MTRAAPLADAPATPGVTAAALVGGDAGPLRRIWRIAAPSWLRLGGAVLLATGALASSVGLLAVSAWLISRASQMPPILHLQVAIVAVRALGISRGVLRYAERLVGHDAALRSLTAVRVAVYGRLERLSPAGLGGHRRGDLLARLVGDVDSTVDLFVRVVIPGLSGILAGLGAVLVGAALLPAAGVALIVLLVTAGLVAPALTAALGARAGSARAQAEGELSAALVASLTAAAELRAFGVVDEALAGVAAADARISRLDRRAATASGLGEGLSALGNGLTVVACLGLGTAAVRAGQLDGVWLATVALLPLAMADVLSGLPAAALARARVAGAARRILAVVDAPDPVPAGPGPDEPPASGAGLLRGAASGESPAGGHAAELAAVTARYPQAVGDALAGLDLDLSGGRRVALVGPSGSGKSTAVAVLLRLLDHRSGHYALDGRDVRGLEEDLVRSVIGAVDQQAHLFDTTIEENLRLARREATAEQLRGALAAAELTAWVDSLPAGLGTRVGAHGSQVSGGEAQRLALARAVLADRPIVLLDEPGEHLDAEMADRVTAAALHATAGRTVLLVTHRMAHTGACDEVVVLSAGAVAERGAPASLGGW